jgi:hypothetical protein
MNGVNWVISESRMIMILSFLTDEVVFWLLFFNTRCDTVRL